MIKKYLIALAFGTFLSAAASTPVQAGPIVAAVAAFAASPIGGFVISTVVSIGAGLLERLLTPASASSTDTSPTPGTELSLQLGGNVPVSFLLGHCATAGSLIYPGTWGNSGQTPNAYMTRAICISDLTCALTGMWVNDQKITLPTMTGSPPTSQGWPVAQFNVSGVDYLWVKFLDGTQTSADSFLTGTFGSHPTRPFTSDMIGRGQAIVIVTALYNRDLFAAEPTYFFESSGIPLYNPALDTSVGGSGSQRWATPSTWSPSDNPVVQAYNLRRGVFYYGASTLWLYGGNNQVALDVSRLPVANWIAGINACDALVTNADSSTEKSFRAGGEITGDMQPVDVIDTLLQSCNGRMAEVGGIYKIQIGLPGSSVYSFTDADILISEGQTFDPFPGLESTNNAIEATYPEPIEKWGTKDAPGLYSSTLEAADGGRRLVASVQFPMVPYPLQVQRLCKALILDSRRFRNHQITLPPDAWVLEPGVDMVSWTSTANGYSSKNFLVTAITGKRGYNQVVSLKEVDPNDYTWNAGTDQQTTTTGTLSTIRPPAQVLTGWTAFAADFIDGTGTARRPGIGVTWDSGQVDVRGVLVTVREKVSGNVEWSGEINYAKFPGGGTLPHAFLPAVTYQAQGDYIPYSGRQHTPSSWLDVTTSNISVDLPDFGPRISVLVDFYNRAIADLQEGAAKVAAVLDAQDFANYQDKQSLQLKVSSQVGSAMAISGALFQAATSAIAAEATARIAAIAALGTAVAGGLIEFDSTVTGSGGSSVASITIKVRAQVGDAAADSGIVLQASADGLGGTTSQILMKASQIYFTDGVHNAQAVTIDASTGNLIFQQGLFQSLKDISQSHISINGNTGAVTFSS